MFRALSARLQEDRFVYLQHTVLSLFKQVSGQVILDNSPV